MDMSKACKSFTCPWFLGGDFVEMMERLKDYPLFCGK